MKTKDLITPVSVRLSIYDWEELSNFVCGDLHCMDEDNEVKEQMRRILRTIQEAIALKRFKKVARLQRQKPA